MALYLGMTRQAPLYLYEKATLCVNFTQTISRAEYIYNLYELFEHFVGAPPRAQKFRDMRGGQANALRAPKVSNV